MSGLKKMNLKQALCTLSFTESHVSKLINERREQLEIYVRQHREGLIKEDYYDLLRDQCLDTIESLGSVLNFLKGAK